MLILDKLVNSMSYRGKKSKSIKIVTYAIQMLTKKTNIPCDQIEKKIIDNVISLHGIKKKKIGGAIYQVPIDIKRNKAITISIRWIVQHAKARPDKKNMQEGLYLELLDIFLMKGKTFKKKQEIQKIINNNKAFSHYK